MRREASERRYVAPARSAPVGEAEPPGAAGRRIRASTRLTGAAAHVPHTGRTASAVYGLLQALCSAESAVRIISKIAGQYSSKISNNQSRRAALIADADCE